VLEDRRDSGVAEIGAAAQDVARLSEEGHPLAIGMVPARSMPQLQ
jgi:hypothetical protein